MAVNKRLEIVNYIKVKSIYSILFFLAILAISCADSKSNKIEIEKLQVSIDS
jgi:hypothetical protein